jgi:hypothetical protein
MQPFVAANGYCQAAKSQEESGIVQGRRTNAITLTPDPTTTIVKALAPVAQDPPSANLISIVNIHKRRSFRKRAHTLSYLRPQL